MEIQSVSTVFTDIQIGKDPKSFGRSIPSEFSKPSRLEVVAENIAEQGINNQRTKNELTPPPRTQAPDNNTPVPANLYAKILEDVEKQNQKEARLQQGPSLLNERFTPLKDTPLVDEMYQLFLKNEHIEHPELNEEREVYTQEVAGAEGAQGDITLAPQLEDLTGIVRNGVSLDGLPSMYSNNPDFSLGSSLRGDDLYKEILDNIHLEDRVLHGMMAPESPEIVQLQLEKGSQVDSDAMRFAYEYGLEFEEVSRFKEDSIPRSPVQNETGGESREGLLSAKMILNGDPNTEAL